MSEASKSSLHQMASDAGEDAPLLSRKVLFSGLSFALFGLTGLLLSLTVFPMCYLLPVTRAKRQRWSRTVLSRVFPTFIRFMKICGLIQVRHQNFDILQSGGRLIVANHPSLLDVVYLIASVENANCLVKPSLFFNPFTAGTVRAAGYIRNDSDTLLQRATESLRAGDTLIVFPEGTRTHPDKPFRFLRGAANIALEAGSDVWPVTIRCTPARLMKNQSWYEMSRSTLQVSLTAHPPLEVAPYLDDSLPRSRQSRRLTRDLEAFYTAQ
ncbi:MAG: lysophospholipid acyltransferase family protein [Halioglobus sp.]